MKKNYNNSSNNKYIVEEAYNIDGLSISDIIRDVCIIVLERHFQNNICEEDIIGLGSGLIKLSISTFSIALLCDNKEIVQEYISFMNNDPSEQELVDYIKKIEKHIDRDTYLLNTTKLLYNMINHTFDLDFYNLDLSKINGCVVNNMNNKNHNGLDEKLTMYELLKIYLGMKTKKHLIIPDYELLFEYGKIGFSDSKEVYENIKIKKDINYSNISKIEEILKNNSTINNLSLLIKDIPTDLIINLFKNKEIGKHIIKCCKFLDYYNSTSKDVISDYNIYMKDLKFFMDIPDKISEENITKAIAVLIKKYSYYMDMDKLVDMVIKAIEIKLNEGLMNPEEAKIIINKLIKTKINKNKKIDYSHLMNRFIDNDFIPQEELNIIKNKVLNGTINIDSIDNKLFSLLKISKSEIESIMDYNINNFIYGIKSLGYINDRIINRYKENDNFSLDEVIIESYRLNKISDKELLKQYKEGKISIDFFVKYSNEIRITKDLNIINIAKLYQKYKTSINKDNNDLLLIDISTEVYKNKSIKNEKDLIKSSALFIGRCLDLVDDEEDILYFYTKGLISLDVVAEWCGEEVIKKLFSTNKIKLLDIEKLYSKKKISRDLIEEIVLKTNPTDEEIIKYMYKNYFKEETIINLFLTRNIYSKEALNLRRLNIISKNTYFIIKNRDIKEMESRIGRSLEGIKEIEEIEMPTIKGDTISLPKVEYKNELKSTNEESYNYGSIVQQKTLINPFIRLEYLKLLKCKSPEHIFYDDEKNPFYHYNFYVIQEEYLGNNITNDAIIIAERIFINRDNKKEFATDNATYVMRYEDYLTLQGKQKELQLKNKKGVIKEVPGAIYSINHRSGSWAMNLLKAIAKSRSGSSMEDLTPNKRRYEIINWLHTIYTESELSEISDLIEEIDDYELHTHRPDRFGIYRNINAEKEKVYTK